MKEVLTKSLAGNEYLDVRAHRDFRAPGEVNQIVMARTKADPRAQFAMSCIERWGLAAAEQDGEDSAGRARIRRSSPAEVVSAACECAERAFDAFHKLGWIIDLPTLEDAKIALQEAEDEAENSNA